MRNTRPVPWKLGESDTIFKIRVGKTLHGNLEIATERFANAYFEYGDSVLAMSSWEISEMKRKYWLQVDLRSAMRVPFHWEHFIFDTRKLKNDTPVCFGYLSNYSFLVDTLLSIPDYMASIIGFRILLSGNLGAETVHGSDCWCHS